MIYSLIHIMLLAAATLGLWLVRSRILIAAACFLVFPLPAALFSLYATPNPLPSLVGVTTVGACIQRTAPAADSASSDTPGEAGKPDETSKASGPAPACLPDDTSRGQILFAVICVNYLTVLIGFAAGLLARRPSPRSTTDRGRGSPPGR